MPLAQRIAELENRLPVAVKATDDLADRRPTRISSSSC